MKRILINATQSEELRVAMVDGQRLYDLDIEVPSREQKKSNIYKGKITRVEPSLEAAFVNYGAERHGFLPFKEIAKEYYGDVPRDESGKPQLKDALKVDQEIIVQVEKEERGNKGAALTSFISLAGRFLVAMPQNPRAGGVSRRIEGDDRDELKRVLAELKMPEGMGVIVRTAGVGRSVEEMQWDLDYLTQVWSAIEKASDSQPAPFLIYQESDIVVRALRDHYRNDIGEILIDSEAAYQQAHDFMSMVMPNSLHKLKRFEDKMPLFNRFQIENQIESAFSREVRLPSGGAIVIDHTEALTSIDVNSARATRGSDIEETAKNTNLEAADEIARQLRIRDLGGLIVIDFIDMMQNKNQRDVENRLRNAVYDDRARVQIGRISRFGLLEMSRQRLRPSLEESSQIVCPRCSGQGTIRDVESLSLAVLRLLEDEALKDSTGRILTKIPVECATYLLNEKREKIDSLEQRRNVHIVVIPDPKLETPHYVIERVRDNDTHRHESNYKKSYEMTTEETAVDLVGMASSTVPVVEQAAVQRVAPSTPRPSRPEAPPPPAAESGGWLARILRLFSGGAEPETEDDKTRSATADKKDRGGRGRRTNRGRGAQTRQQGSESTAAGNGDKARETGRDGERARGGDEQRGGGDDKRGGGKRGGRTRGGRGNRGGRARQNDSKAGDNAESAAGAAAAAADDGGAAEKSEKRQADSRRSRSRRRSPGKGQGAAEAGAEKARGEPKETPDAGAEAEKARNKPVETPAGGAGTPAQGAAQAPADRPDGAERRPADATAGEGDKGRSAATGGAGDSAVARREDGAQPADRGNGSRPSGESEKAPKPAASDEPAAARRPAVATVDTPASGGQD